MILLEGEDFRTLFFVKAHEILTSSNLNRMPEDLYNSCLFLPILAYREFGVVALGSLKAVSI